MPTRFIREIWSATRSRRLREGIQYLAGSEAWSCRTCKNYKGCRAAALYNKNALAAPLRGAAGPENVLDMLYAENTPKTGKSAEGYM